MSLKHLKDVGVRLATNIKEPTTQLRCTIDAIKMVWQVDMCNTKSFWSYEGFSKIIEHCVIKATNTPLFN